MPGLLKGSNVRGELEKLKRGRGAEEVKRAVIGRIDGILDDFYVNLTRRVIWPRNEPGLAGSDLKAVQDLQECWGHK